MIISRRQHPVVQELRDWRDRHDSGYLFLEGSRLVREVLKSPCAIDTFVFTANADAELVAQITPLAKRVLEVSSGVFDLLSDVRSPQGVIAFCRRPVWTWEQLVAQSPAPIMVLDRLQNPGNMATILRTAEAVGAAGIITTPETVHVFQPKALRGSMGSSLRVPVLERQRPAEIVSQLATAHYQLVAAEQGEKSIEYTALEWGRPLAFVVGQEGSGLAPEWRELISELVYIPMNPLVESLNVAVAAALLLYEWKRHRTKDLPRS